jgi:hypothetical protein
LGEETVVVLLQFLEVTIFDDPTRFQNYNAIALLNRGEAMRNDYGCAILHDVLQSDLNFPLRGFIQCRGRLIEDKELRFADYSSGNRDSLLLPPRQLATLDAALNAVSIMQLDILLLSASAVYVTFDSHKTALFLFFFSHVLQNS